MIRAADIRQRILERPFQPFRIFLKDGRQFDIHDPFWTLVGEPVVLIGIAPKDDPLSKIPDHHEWVDYGMIERVETLPAAVPAS